MKDWLSDKKNLPIIIGAAAVLLIGAVVAALFETGVLGGQSGSSTASVAPPGVTPPPPGSPPAPVSGAPAGPIPDAPQTTVPGGAPAAHPNPFGAPVAVVEGTNSTAAQSAAARINASQLTPKQKAAALKVAASITPTQAAAFQNMTPAQRAAMGRKMFASLAKTGLVAPDLAALMSRMSSNANHNPFAPTYNVSKLNVTGAPPPVSQYVPFLRLARLPNPGSVIDVPVTGPNGPVQISVPLGRVAGVINSNGIRAIYEVDGQDVIVTPGSLLPEGGGRVQSIQSNGITVRLPDSHQTVQVPISAGNPATAGYGGQQPPDTGAGAPPPDTGNNDQDNG